MASAEVVNQLNLLGQVGSVGDLSDGQLLQRFLTAPGVGSRAAFTVLVGRHGAMVLCVCRQILSDTNDAEDAFQATFLVLARKAGSVRKADSLASWLHGVARRVAARARTDAFRRREFERRGAAMKAAETQGGEDRTEAWPELHEEIARLPERYRLPVVLCYLEGLTTGEAAARVGCPQGTILSRLSRARERLRQRLTRRDVSLPEVWLATGRASGVTSPALPASLIETTVRASLGFAGRRTAEAALASATATALARGVLFTMTISRLKAIGAVVLACSVVLGGARTFGQFGGLGGTGNPPSATPEEHEKKAIQSRAANLSRLVDKLQAELDEATRRNDELRKELNDVRVEVKALSRRVVPPKAAVKEVAKKDTKPGPTAETAFGAVHPSYFRLGQHIIASSPRGDKVMSYDTVSRKSTSQRLVLPGESAVEVSFIIGPGSAALSLKGPKIMRIAAASSWPGEWVMQDLREPVEGTATPIVGSDVLAYALGRYVYAFSPGSNRWDVVKLPEGVSATPSVGPGSVTVEGGGHIFTFRNVPGKWSDIDLNAILNAVDEKQEGGTEPKD